MQLLLSYRTSHISGHACKSPCNGCKYQIHTGEKRVIADVSKMLSPSQQAYCIIKHESLAIIWFLKHFQRYLEGTWIHYLHRSQGIEVVMNLGQHGQYAKNMHLTDWLFWLQTCLAPAMHMHTYTLHVITSHELL